MGESKLTVAPKKLYVYKMWSLSPGSVALKHPAPNLDWGAVLTEWAKKTLTDQEIEEDLYAVPELSQELPVLGLHRRAESTFQSQIDVGKESITDLDSLLDGETFTTNSSAVVFFADKGLVAIARGNAQSPGVKDLEKFLGKCQPLAEDGKWSVKPVMDSAKIEEFRSAGGIRRFEAKFNTMKDLLNAEAEASVLTESLDAIAEALGGNLKVDIVISLEDSAAQRKKVREKFKSQVLKALERLSGSGKVSVSPVADDGTEGAALSLVESKYSVELDVPIADTKKKTFTELAVAAAKFCIEKSPSIVRMVE